MSKFIKIQNMFFNLDEIAFAKAAAFKVVSGAYVPVIFITTKTGNQCELVYYEKEKDSADAAIREAESICPLAQYL